jgi:hypothetical protein
VESAYEIKGAKTPLISKRLRSYFKTEIDLVNFAKLNNNEFFFKKRKEIKMKKLLLVLAVVAMASFLLVGCLPGMTPDPVFIAVEDEYPDALTGKIYIRCDELDITVTFAEAIAEDQDVWVRYASGSDYCDWYQAVGTGTVFVAEDVMVACKDCPECGPVCIEVMVGDVCCAEVIYHEVRMIDDEAPLLALYLTVVDCGPCDDMANIFFTSSKMGECDVEEECCYDDCSGVESWTVKVWGPVYSEEEWDDIDLVCDTPCFEYEATCPIDGSTGCLDCLVFGYESGEEVIAAVYYVEVTMSDNVGNGWEDEWYMELGIDEIIVVDTMMTWEHYPDEDGIVTVYDLCEWFENN